MYSSESPSLENVEAQRDEAMVFVAEGVTQYPGMSYEAGIHAALEWVLGETEDAPIS